ncbi:MAG: LysR family transcriptional regulator [Rhodobacterales bacterium]|nr:LysR family transcriptional regulator [Rhodobacterales bacterium]
MDTLNGMAVFAKVVETGSFSGAARDLGQSKSAVSKQVARLEDRLKARLLNRTTRRLSLTEVGQAFYDRAQRILAEVTEAEEAVSTLQARPRGTLRVNVPMSFGIQHVGPHMAAFMARYPDLNVDLTLNDRRVDLVDEGYDLAVRIGVMADSSLIARRLAPLRGVVCAAPAYWERHPPPSRPQDLADHDCLIYTYNPSGTEMTFHGPDGPVAVRLNGRLRANNGDVLRSVAVAGGGVCVAPSFIVGDDLRAGRLVHALPEYGWRDGGVYAVYPHNRHLSPKVRAFVDFLVEIYGDAPYWDAGCPEI